MKLKVYLKKKNLNFFNHFKNFLSGIIWSFYFYFINADIHDYENLFLGGISETACCSSQVALAEKH